MLTEKLQLREEINRLKYYLTCVCLQKSLQWNSVATWTELRDNWQLVLTVLIAEVRMNVDH
jgi:hypothetical protein